MLSAPKRVAATSAVNKDGFVEASVPCFFGTDMARFLGKV